MSGPATIRSAQATMSPQFAASARQLALLLVGLVLISMLPSVFHLNLTTAPNWSRVLLLSGTLLLVYLAWMSLAPCRATLWSICWTFALAASGSVLLLAITMFTSADRPLPLEITTSRGVAIAWCAVIATLLSVGSLLAGRTAHRAPS